ncbi:MAG: hypothetical protein M1587_09215 [Thaumarchaeota archaeon]|nr:hypothetical protein [Nitrososphaerota archaeon]MCL5067777.1 hypothetical protein [Nitrososphaerota archaeon]
MKISEVILLAGLIGILFGPVISMMPIFTPPPNGCPCPDGLDVRTPFVDSGIIVAIVGVVLISGGLLFHAKSRDRYVAKTGSSQKARTTTAAAVSGLILLLVSGILSNIDISGPGYQIYLYSAQGFYLGIVAVGALLFSGFSIATPKMSIALSLAAGVVLCGLALFLISAQYSDFLPRCSTDVGCNATLARNLASDLLDFGYMLAVGSFLAGFGSSYLLTHRKKEATSELVEHEETKKS